MGDFFLQAVCDFTAYYVWPAFGISTYMECFSGYDPIWQLAHALPIWQKAFEHTLITDAMQGRLQHVDKDRIQIIVERHMRHYLRDLLNALRERGLDLKLPIVFAGGGAELFGKRLYSGEVNTITILDRFANAEGYKLLLG